MKHEIAIDREETLKVLKDLVSINSVNPSLSMEGKGEREIAAYICEYMQRLGLETRFQEFSPGRVNAVGIFPGSGGGRSLMLNGHADTVGAEGMEATPFQPVLRNGRLYGRGVYDMKAGLAAQLAAVRAIVRARIPLKGDLVMAAVADEEYSSLGTENLVQTIKTDAAILAEPTDLRIVIAHKGFAWIRIETTGRAAHGGLPEKGIDAIVKAGKVLAQVEYMEEKIYPAFTHPLLGRPSLHAAMIIGGKEISTYPDYCELKLERRTLPSESRETVDKEVRAMLARAAAGDRRFDGKYEIFFFRPGVEIDRDSAVVKSLERAYRKILPNEPVFSGLYCWMDSAILTAAGIPSVIFGPSGDGAHAAVEYADLESVITSADILAHTAADFCA